MTYKFCDEIVSESFKHMPEAEYTPGELVAVRNYTFERNLWCIQTYKGKTGGKRSRYTTTQHFDGVEFESSWDQICKLPQNKPQHQPQETSEMQTASPATFKDAVQTLLDKDLIVSVEYKAAVEGVIFSFDKDDFSHAVANINHLKLKKQALAKLTPEEIQALGL